MKWLIPLATLLVLSACIDEGDWVDSFDLPIGFGARPFFAGYLKLNSLQSIYYVYTPSEENPSKDPLVVFLSPFPGCSGLHSWLYFNGEFVFTKNSDNFRHNPHNWNRQANVLYLEGPAGTGFSKGANANITDQSTT